MSKLLKFPMVITAMMYPFAEVGSRVTKAYGLRSSITNSGKLAEPWAVDSGASEDIVDSLDPSSYTVIRPCGDGAHAGTVIEAKGSDALVQKEATMELPGTSGERVALGVPKTPNSCSAGKLVELDGHTFVWSNRFGAWMFLREGGRIKLDVINRVPHLPPTNRSADVRCLADLG